MVDLGEKAVVPTEGPAKPPFKVYTKPQTASDPGPYAENTKVSQPVSRPARAPKARTQCSPGALKPQTPPPAWDDHTAWRAACLRAPSIDARRTLISAWAEAAGGSIDWDIGRHGLQLPRGLPECPALEELRQHFLDEIELI